MMLFGGWMMIVGLLLAALVVIVPVALLAGIAILLARSGRR